MPGVRELLAEASQRGLRTAIVTRNREDRVREMCGRVGLDHEWHALVCANEDPTGDKAELYRRAVAGFEVQPDQALAFEDSPSGVHSAKQAGVRCVAVPNDVTRGAAFDEADLVLPSLARSLDEIV